MMAGLLHRIVGRLSVLLLLVAGIAVSLPPKHGFAADPASPDPAAVRITEFYVKLVETMKLGEKSKIEERYDKLRPAIEEAFNLPKITALITGPAWESMEPRQREALIKGFRHMTVANYAKNFDSFSGERFEVEPRSIPRDGFRFVRSRMVRPNKEPVTLDYLMYRADGKWKIIDVYYQGTISELATRRSELSAILRKDGFDALVRKLQEVGDRLMADG